MINQKEKDLSKNLDLKKLLEKENHVINFNGDVLLWCSDLDGKMVIQFVTQDETQKAKIKAFMELAFSNGLKVECITNNGEQLATLQTIKPRINQYFDIP
jgi:hypothetical protein